MTRISPEAKAWACLGANALVLPGLGSVLAGRWLAGLLQALASLVGFASTMLWMFSWLGRAADAGTLLLEPGPELKYGVGGVALFGFAWVWGLLTGLRMLRRDRSLAGKS